MSGAQKANIDANKKRAREEEDAEESEEEDEGETKRPRVNGVDQDEEGTRFAPRPMPFLDAHQSFEAPMEEESDDEGEKPDVAEPVATVEPHYILAVDRLPAEVSDDMLKVLFQQ